MSEVEEALQACHDIYDTVREGLVARHRQCRTMSVSNKGYTRWAGPAVTLDTEGCLRPCTHSPPRLDRLHTRHRTPYCHQAGRVREAGSGLPASRGQGAAQRRAKIQATRGLRMENDDHR